MTPLLIKEGDTLIDRYVVGRLHAEGSMQFVHQCFDKSLNRTVVAKTPKEGIKDRRFRRGAEMGARVNHPNVAATLDYFENEEFTFMVEEFVPGFDLSQRITNEFFHLDPSLAAHVIHHISRALHEAHKVGICHRDLKPSNVMTSADPSMAIIKLTDFGIAKLAEKEIAVEMGLFDEDESTLTTSSTLLGAVPYLAPECWSDWSGAGKPMDIWALGCIAYYVLTGLPPFGMGRAAIANVLKAEQQGCVSISTPSWFGSHPSSAPLEADLWNLILRCLEIDPSKRPDAGEVSLICDSLRYAAAPRRTGSISTYGRPYPNGQMRKTGYIRPDDGGENCFFHRTDFYGAVSPEENQRVNFCCYPGVPNSRSSPVLLIR